MIITIDTSKADDVAQGYLILSQMIGGDMAHNRTESGSEDVEKEKVTPSIPEEENAVEAPVEKKAPAKRKPRVSPESVEEEQEACITLDTLKNSAKEATLRVDRVEVKKTIGKYAVKLAEVKPEDYGFLYKDLQLLGK